MQDSVIANSLLPTSYKKNVSDSGSADARSSCENGRLPALCLKGSFIGADWSFGVVGTIPAHNVVDAFCDQALAASLEEICVLW